jgi:hypothetical protein
MRLIHKAKKYVTGTYNVLLTLLLVLFILRPYKYADLYPGIWKIFLTFALLFAIYDCHHRRIVQIAASILAIPALIFSWVVMFEPTKFTELGLVMFSGAFLLVCTTSIIYDVLLRARVTIETLRGVVCAYFLVAFLFAYIYTVVEYFLPNSFLIEGQTVSQIVEVRFFSDMLYFSFTTLLTIGFGDVVAVRELAQTCTVLEGIIGQFYIAILVARIVAVYSEKRLLEQIHSKKLSD